MDNCPTCGSYLLQGDEFCLVCRAEIEAPTMRALDPDAPPVDDSQPVQSGSANDGDVLPVRRVVALVAMFGAMVAILLASGVLTTPDAGSTATGSEAQSTVAPADREAAALCARTIGAVPDAPLYEPAISRTHRLQVVDLRPSAGVAGEDFSTLQQWVGRPAELVLCIREDASAPSPTILCPAAAAAPAVQVRAQSVMVELRVALSGATLWSSTFAAEQASVCDRLDRAVGGVTPEVPAVLPTDQIGFVVSRWVTPQDEFSD